MRDLRIVSDRRRRLAVIFFVVMVVVLSSLLAAAKSGANRANAASKPGEPIARVNTVTTNK
jgi:hypothetical protein